MEIRDRSDPLPSPPFLYKWTIQHVGALYAADTSNLLCIASDAFSPYSDDADVPTFYLRLFPRGIAPDPGCGTISLYIYLKEGTGVSTSYVNIIGHFYLVNFLTGKKCNEQTFSGSITKYNPLGVVDFAHKEQIDCLSYGLSFAGHLTVHCQINIYLPHLQLTSRIITQSSCCTNALVNVSRHESQHKLEHFRFAHENLERVTSPNFSPDTLNEIQFNLQLWPNFNQHVSLYLCLDQCRQALIRTQTCFSILDTKNNKCKPKWFENRQLFPSNFLGCDRYIDCFELFKHENNFLTDDTLKIHCQIEIIEDRFGNQASPLDNTNSNSDVPITTIVYQTNHITNMNESTITESIISANASKLTVGQIDYC